jgi:hypothetical protein
MVLLEDGEKNTSGLIHEGESFGDWKIRIIENKSATIGLTEDEPLTISLHPESLEPISTEKSAETLH